MNKQFSISNDNHKKVVDSLGDAIDEILSTGGTAEVELSTEKPTTGKWGMARLWRAWMSTTADFMHGNGVVMPLYIDKDGKWHGERRFDKDDAHKLFTKKWLGVDGDGNRLSWAKGSTDNGKVKADKGQRVHAMQKHDAWATERGIFLFHPVDSEYQELIDRQNR